MKRFACAQVAKPRWEQAVDSVVAILRAKMHLTSTASNPSLGLVYITEPFAAHASDILDALLVDLPSVTDWCGATAIGVCTIGELMQGKPALSVMLCDLPQDQYRVYSGVVQLPPPLQFQPQVALVHAEGNTPDLTELIDELSTRTGMHYLFGGLTAKRAGCAPQIAWSANHQGKGPKGRTSGVFRGGFSGVAIGYGITVISRVAQGCTPIAPQRRVSGSDGPFVLMLDGQPALDVMLADLGLDAARTKHALDVLSNTLVGLEHSPVDTVKRTRDFGPEVRVRNVVGIDAHRRGFALTEGVGPGQSLTFCSPDPKAAQADLVRICTEIREALEPQEPQDTIPAPTVVGHSKARNPVPRILGAHYVSCAARWDKNFGLDSDIRIIERALGDVPLTGFSTSGEIASSYLYGYSSVLTVFATNSPS